MEGGVVDAAGAQVPLAAVDEPPARRAWYQPSLCSDTRARASVTLAAVT
jgi:hypothetical protein